MSRAFRITLLLLETLWFVVLVPNHTRGQIACPGDSVKSCCDSRAEKSSHPVPVKSCAVCYFIATLDVPPAIILVSPPATKCFDDRIPRLTSAIVNELSLRPDLARAPPGCFT